MEEEGLRRAAEEERLCWLAEARCLSDEKGRAREAARRAEEERCSRLAEEENRQAEEAMRRAEQWRRVATVLAQGQALLEDCRPAEARRGGRPDGEVAALATGSSTVLLPLSALSLNLSIRCLAQGILPISRRFNVNLSHAAAPMGINFLHSPSLSVHRLS